MQLKQKINSATSAIKSVFGQEENKQQDAVKSWKCCKLGILISWYENVSDESVLCLIGWQVGATKRENGKSAWTFSWHRINGIRNSDNSNGNETF